MQTLRRLAAALDTHLVVGFADEIPGIQSTTTSTTDLVAVGSEDTPTPAPARPPGESTGQNGLRWEAPAPGNVHVRQGAQLVAFEQLGNATVANRGFAPSRTGKRRR